MYSRAKGTIKILTILLGCYGFLSSAIIVCEGADKRTLKSHLSSKELDLSTPEKTIALFVEAFKIGDENMLIEVLAPNASLPEFNPIQEIECPSPWIMGFDIRKFRVVQKRGQYAVDSKPGDIEVYVLLKTDEKLIVKKSKCMVSLWETGAYLLRKADNKWRIVAVAPFWPDEVEGLTK